MNFKTSDVSLWKFPSAVSFSVSDRYTSASVVVYITPAIMRSAFGILKHFSNSNFLAGNGPILALKLTLAQADNSFRFIFSKVRQRSVTWGRGVLDMQNGFGSGTAKIERNEPTQVILAFFVLRKFILQRCMRSHPVGLDVWFLVWPFDYFHSSCVRTAKALARLCRCAGSPEPSLVAYAICTIISWAGSNNF